MFSFPAQSRCINPGPGPSSSPGPGLAQLAQFLALARPSQTAPQLRCLVIIVRIIVKLCRLAAPTRFPLVFPTPPAHRLSCRAAELQLPCRVSFLPPAPEGFHILSAYFQPCFGVFVVFCPTVECGTGWSYIEFY